jgi:phage tail-like protein
MPGPKQKTLEVARVSLVVDGDDIAQFSELVSISHEVEAVEYREGGDADHVKLLPGKSKPPTIVLQRPLTSGLELWVWHDSVRAGDIGSYRKSITLVLYDIAGKPVVRYQLEHAWPSKLEVGAAEGHAAQLFERVTLTCEALQRVKA